jgi:hypothetical protein
MLRCCLIGNGERVDEGCTRHCRCVRDVQLNKEESKPSTPLRPARNHLHEAFYANIGCSPAALDSKCQYVKLLCRSVLKYCPGPSRSPRFSELRRTPSGIFASLAGSKGSLGNAGTHKTFEVPLAKFRYQDAHEAIGICYLTVTHRLNLQAVTGAEPQTLPILQHQFFRESPFQLITCFDYYYAPNRPERRENHTLEGEHVQHRGAGNREGWGTPSKKSA